ncbi:oligosaccharide flippase family protein [Winogradskyella aurantia]|uniref:Polysaccharide biosynthesis protein n=1 Tax=Winogradskyella aurantia TaxID=1915063 RepID=A0A265UZP9_9FLAO|nr:polysaccharide biosynthesis C-terminal domain-containing protein [Winogradskyella aurantia]OZV70785.1 polysaccharide biosynthesis protein [Winogradskyella aurantia]
MSAFKTLFKQTFIYGLATVLPRMLSFLLVPLYTSEQVLPNPAEYGKVSVIFSYFVLFNVLLAYGMETAFFRFFNKQDDKETVVGTASISLILSSFGFFTLGFLLQDQIAHLIDIDVRYINLVVWILLLDALVIIPFAWLRANEKPSHYAIIKLLNVAINIGLNLFFLLALKHLAQNQGFFQNLYRPNFEISYIFIANLVASASTVLFFIPFYITLKYRFSMLLWKQMMVYAVPVLIAGIAFSINETFDRILLKELLPDDVAENDIGMYSACYKLALFMTLFATAYRLGIEPYFFSHAKAKNPQKNYANILEFFVAFGSIILLAVVVFADFIKPLIIRSEAYWEAMWVVPIILIANFCLGIYHNLSVWYKITDRTKFGAYISVIGAIITLVINLVFIKYYSYKASAVATLVAYAVMMALSYYFGRRYYPIPYNLKKIGFYMLSSISFSVVSFYYYRDNFIVGLVMLIVFLGLVIMLEKNQLKQVLKG